MSTPTVAIIDPFHPRILDKIREGLPSGWRLSITEAADTTARARALKGAEVAFVMATPMPRALLEQADSLRFIQKLGAGTDRIATDYCAERGICVARLQAGNDIPVAEHTILLILATCRRLPLLDAQTRAGAWDKEEVRGSNRHIHGKTVGIVGFGAIGRQVARLLSGFGVSLVYYDPVRASAEDEATLKAQYRDLEDLLAEADVVTLHLPLLPQTRGLLSAERIALMKPDAILINAARGGLVDEAALLDALRSGRIFGAGLDAFSEEPPTGNPLLDAPNTVVTPHCAGATVDNFTSITARAVANARRFLAGEPLPPGDLVVGGAPASS